ncbi:MAG: DNA topoisomerase IV subunit B, partial [Pirellulaceae bacterium]
ATASVRGTGTTITFTPDPTIFPKTEFDAETIRQRLETTSYLHRGVRVCFVDETTSRKDQFHHEQGIVDYLGKVLQQRTARPIHEAPFTLRKDGDERLEIALQWTESTDEHVRSYCNGIPTG